MLLSLLLFSCDGDRGTGDYQLVQYDLQGTWERTEAAFYPEGQTVYFEKGKIILDYNSITIIGPLAQMQGYTRGIALEAYTDREENLLYIKDRGVWQSPIGFTKWQSSGEYPYNEMLTFTGEGVADETLVLISSN